jgi:hypothetical protein
VRQQNKKEIRKKKKPKKNIMAHNMFLSLPHIHLVAATCNPILFVKEDHAVADRIVNGVCDALDWNGS